MRKGIYLLIASLLAGSLYGCGQKNNTSNNTNDETTSTNIDKEVLLEKVKDTLDEKAESVFFYDFNMDEIPELCLLNDKNIALYIYDETKEEYTYKQDILLQVNLLRRRNVLYESSC